MSHFNKTHHKLPDFDEFILELFIDANGICSVNYEEVQKQKQHEDPVEITVKTEYITVGIKSSEGEFVYGSDIAEKRTCKIDDIVEKLHDIDKIDSIFDELKEKLNLTANQNLKNLYLFLDYSYKSEIRKKLIEAGIKCGFEKVEIVDQESMNLFCGITECKNVENFEDCIIWILKGLQCHLWKKTALHANFIGMIHGDYSNESGLKMMKESSKLNADPNFIFFYDNKNNENVFLQTFPNCEIMTLKETENWKCYTFERDLNQYNLDIDAVQDRKIVAKIGDLEIHVVRPYQKLPFSITKKIINDTDNDELTITEGKDVGIKIPTNDRFCLQIDIDKNGIYSLAVVPDEEEEVVDDEKKDTEIEEKSDLSLSDNDKAVVDELINKTEIEVLEKSNLSLSDTDDELIDIERNKTEIEEKTPPNSSAKDDNPITEGDISNSDDELPIPKSKEKLQALRGPMIMTELFTRDESSNTFAHIISSSASNIHQKFQPSQKDALLSPPPLLNELSLMPPPSYEESESFFRQPSPLPFQSSQISLNDEKHDDAAADDVDATISEVRAKLAEQKLKLIDRLKPKILQWAASEDVKKISDMMAHKDISELLEYLENEDLLEARV
uniref:PABC domain-containing protein n=1 Tax=Panagrolaimus sp. ES5 TaxID=591445 RepID=A0AC34G1H3_9BILA